MARYVGPQLMKLFMLDPRLGAREDNEHEKILFYFPSDTPLNQQQSDVGLSEALISFTKTFSPDKPCEAVHLEKSRQTFFQCEPDIWMVMAVSNPYTVQAKDTETQRDYDGDALADATLYKIVEQTYSMFKLFNGTCADIVKNTSIENLRTVLGIFMEEYIPNIDLAKADLFTALEGVNFLPVDKNVYLRVQSFINWTENNFPFIQNSCFMYRDLLVWSAVEQDDMRILYKYIIDYVLPRQRSASRRRRGDDADRSFSGSEDEPTTDNHVPYLRLPSGDKRKGFLTGPADVTDIKSPIYVPTVYIGNKSEPQHLIIYQLADAMCLFFLKGDASAVKKHSFYASLDKFIAPELGFVAPILAGHWTRKQGYADEYRYIYFNHMNLALKTSIVSGEVVPREYMKLLNDMHHDFERLQNSVGVQELMVRTSDDGWIVGRKSDQREFYVIFDQKNANLLEVNEEVRRLSTTYFNNIFID